MDNLSTLFIQSHQAKILVDVLTRDLLIVLKHRLFIVILTFIIIRNKIINVKEINQGQKFSFAIKLKTLL